MDETKTTFTPEEKVALLQNELNLIKTDILREDTTYVVKNLPDYYFHVAASSTGKYHPNYAQGYQGLLRHVKAAVKIADDLNKLKMYNFSEIQQDYIIIALILHDCCKHGLNGSKFTVHEHPIVASEYITKIMYEKYPDNDDAAQEYCNNVCILIESHMGQWTTNKRSTVILPEPVYPAQQFVHLCDYLASRKYLEVQFDE